MKCTGSKRSSRMSLAGVHRRRSATLLSLCVIAGTAALSVAPALALPASFATEGSRAGQISDPRGIAVNQASGDVYVADHGNRRIDKFGPEGEFLLAWGWGVADGGSEAFQTCTATCFAGIAGSGAGQFLGEGGVEGVAVDSSLLSPSYGDVYAVDPGNARVQKFSPEGEFKLMFGMGVLSGGATGSGTLTSGSEQITSVTTTSKAFVAGQTIAGAGIPSGTTITDLQEDAIGLSKPATASAAGVALTVSAGAGSVPVNERQTVTLTGTPTGGTFTLTLTTPNPSPSSATTDPIAFDAPASGAGSVQVALEGLANVGAGNVAVTGGAGGPYTVEFMGARYADTNVSQMTGESSLTGGSAPEVSVATVVEGHSAPADDICGSAPDRQAGVEGSGPGAFEGLIGRSIAVDSAGTVYVGDSNRVQRLNGEGVVEGAIALSGVGRIENLAVDSAKDLYVRGGAQEGVHKYDPAGTPLGSPRDEAAHAEFLVMATGPSDELFVNDFNSQTGYHHIVAFNAAGEQTASFDAGGLAVDAGRFGIAYSEHTNALYVLNSGSVRIVTPPPPGPFVLLGSESAGEVQPTSATLAAKVNPEGAPAEYHFEYGTTTAYGVSTPVATLNAVDEIQSVTVTATGGVFTLAFNGEGSGEIPFNATAGEVEAALDGIPGLGAGQVAVSGEAGGPWSVQFTGARAGRNVPQLTVNAGGLAGPEPGAVVATTTAGFSLFDDRAAAATIKELQPSTTYHYRVLATNGSQTVPGPDRTFTTLPPVSIDGTSVSEVNATSARLQADLNPHGLPSEYRFEYDTAPYVQGQPPHGTKIPVPDASAGSATVDTTVSNLVGELLPSTTYHYRLIVHNALGAVEGPERSFTTQGSGSVLPDGRSWEEVSPPNKHGSPLEPLTEEGGLIQAAAGGGGMAYVALGPVNDEPKGAKSPYDSQLLSTRTPSGWFTQDATTPSEDITQIVPGEASEYRFFAEDLSAGVVEPPGATPLSPKTTERTPYRREANGDFVPLVSAANVPPETKFGGEELTPPGSGLWGHGVRFETASPDLSHLLLGSPQVLASGFPPEFVPPTGADYLYELAGGTLQLVSVLPDGEPASGGLPHEDKRGAISSSGQRVVFQAGGHLYVRDVGMAATVQLDEPQIGAAGGEAEARPQVASSDGFRVFFTDTSQLTTDSTATPGQPDLYMCEVEVLAGHLSCVLSDLSVDPNPGEAAGVQRFVTAVDASGGHVYFAASGVLTSTPNADGEQAVPGDCESEGATCNLYEYDRAAHRISLVAVLSGKDNPDWKGTSHELGNLTARSSPDGHYFTFMSQRSLTGYDNRDARSGQPDEEVFQFDSANGAVRCVSCNPTGARPLGIFDPEHYPPPLIDRTETWRTKWLAASIPGWTLVDVAQAQYQSRYLSNSGRMFFNAADALVSQDTNNTQDVYQYEPPGVGDCSTVSKTFSHASGGCINLISSGGSKEESAFLDASESGDEVFFLTASRLTSSDVDSAFDIYDAHVCSASSPCPPPPPPPPASCEGDSCQNPSAPPPDQTPGSLTYKGPGNATPTATTVVKPKPPTRAQLLAKALKTCRTKHNKHRRTSCERAAHKRYATKSSKRKS